VRRREALAHFEGAGYPTRRDEDWHYTSVSAIAESHYAPAPKRRAGAEVHEPRHAPLVEPAVVLVDGEVDLERSRLDAVPHGLTVRTLADALRDDDALVRERLTTLAPPDRDAFTALNTAHFRDGVVIAVAHDAEVTEPLHVLHLVSESAMGAQVTPRLLIVAGRNSRSTVLETFAGPDDARYFTNAVTEVALEDGATLYHARIQQEGTSAHHVGTVEVTQARDSHFVSFSFAAGAALSRANIHTVLDGPGCGATLNGLYMLDGDQHGDHQTRIEHAQPDTFSRELYKGILDGSSHGVFNGKVYVHPVAQKTDGKQTNNTLLLSPKAQIDTKPQLEIFADDVKCTHGATVGQLDETATFYMKSRGVGAAMTRQLLTYAFAAEVLETIEHEALRDGLEALALERYTSA
jgi:Fe-S cluster assembly protein SufD